MLKLYVQLHKHSENNLGWQEGTNRWTKAQELVETQSKQKPKGGNSEVREGDWR